MHPILAIAGLVHRVMGEAAFTALTIFASQQATTQRRIGHNGDVFRSAHGQHFNLCLAFDQAIHRLQHLNF